MDIAFTVRRQVSSQTKQPVDQPLIFESELLFHLIHGVGKASSANLASEAVLNLFNETLAPTDTDDSAQWLSELYQEANRALRSRTQTDPNLQDAMCVAISAKVSGKGIMLGHVGDNRAYLLRGGRLKLLTGDHSVMLKETGGSRKQTTNPELSIAKTLSRAIGKHALIKTEVLDVALRPGDRLLLCTEGLWAWVKDAEIQRILNMIPENLELAADQLVSTASAASQGRDVCLILIGVAGKPKQQSPLLQWLPLGGSIALTAVLVSFAIQIFLSGDNKHIQVAMNDDKEGSKISAPPGNPAQIPGTASTNTPNLIATLPPPATTRIVIAQAQATPISTDSPIPPILSTPASEITPVVVAMAETLPTGTPEPQATTSPANLIIASTDTNTPTDASPIAVLATISPIEMPTSTAVPEPEVIPTITLVPKATETSVPTSTLLPTDTPASTFTPKATRTPMPTNTVIKTDTPSPIPPPVVNQATVTPPASITGESASTPLPNPLTAEEMNEFLKKLQIAVKENRFKDFLKDSDIEEMPGEMSGSITKAVLKFWKKDMKKKPPEFSLSAMQEVQSGYEVDGTFYGEVDHEIPIRLRMTRENDHLYMSVVKK